MELGEKKAQLEMLNELKDSNSLRKEIENEDEKNSSCSSPDGAYKIVHQYVPTCRQVQVDKHRKLQVVTQTLHIPPAVAAICSNPDSNASPELEKLRKEVKKLREYARLSVQDRKVLIHKIGTLKDKVHETSVRKSASPLRSLTLTDSSVQCDLLEMTSIGKNQESTSSEHWNLRMAGLQQKLVTLGEAADLMKSQLEALVETLQPETLAVITNLNLGVGTTLSHLTQSSHQLLLSVKKTLEELRNSRNNPDLDQRATESPDFHLPDPNEVELPEHPKDALIRHLYEDIEGKDKELEDKKHVISALSEQVGQKDKVIREQADHLDEYRVEILHLRDEGEQREKKVQQHRQDFDMERKCNVEGHTRTEAEEAASSGFNKNPRIANSEDEDEEEEDSWSEPGTYSFKKEAFLKKILNRRNGRNQNFEIFSVKL